MKKRLPTEAEWKATMAGAPVLKCAACTACRWHPLGKGEVCIYGGPFLEADER